MNHSANRRLFMLDHRAGRQAVGHLRAHLGVLMLAMFAVLSTRFAVPVSTRLTEETLVSFGIVVLFSGGVLRIVYRGAKAPTRRYLHVISSAFILGTPLVCGLIVMTNRSLEGLTPRHIGRINTSAYLVSDPVRDATGIGVTARIKVDGKHLRATAFGLSGTDLAKRSAGESVEVVGTVKGWSREPPSWAVGRHLAGTVSLTTVRLTSRGSVLARLANGVRFRMNSGAASLPPLQRSLFMGFVLGDNREQSIEVADDFRAAGLSHLLVVSGQNVAFVLVAADPLLRRFGSKPRFVFSLVVLVTFGVITRFEPSVLRAGTMAALTLWSRQLGRPQPAIRILSLSVITLLIIDPLLSRSLGFGLSVCATGGLALLSGPIERRLPFRRAISAPLSATFAAQIATFPMLVSLGGVHPLSIAANMVALPVAEPVMVWGVLVGVLAGYVGPFGAAVLHTPSRVLIWFIAKVAWATSSLVQVSWLPKWWPIAPLVGVVVTAAIRKLPTSARRTTRILVLPAVALALTTMHVTQQPSRTTFTRLAEAGFETHIAKGRVIAIAKGRVLPRGVLQGLRDAKVNHVDVLVVSRATGQTWRALQPIRARTSVDLIITPGRDSILEETPILGLSGDENAIIDGWKVTCPKSTCTLIRQGTP